MYVKKKKSVDHFKIHVARSNGPYHDGYDIGKGGFSVSSCPYRKGDVKRTFWMNGHHDGIMGYPKPL